MQTNGPKILVVDDDADLRWMVEKYLSKHEFSVTLAEDGEKMRAALEQQRQRPQICVQYVERG